MSQSHSRTKITISEPINVPHPVLGVTVFAPFECSLPWTPAPNSGLRQKLLLERIVFAVFAAVFASLLLLCLLDLHEKSDLWPKVRMTGLAGILLLGLILFADMIVEVTRTLAILGDGTQPILMLDETGFHDRRIGEGKITWDHVASAHIVFGRGGVLGTRVKLRETTPQSARLKSFQLRFDRMGIPFRKTNSFVVATRGVLEADETVALAVYVLGNRLGELVDVRTK